MNLKDVVRSELIGNEIEIVKAKNKNLNNIKGKIIDETRNMITIQTREGTKQVIKDQVHLKMKLCFTILQYLPMLAM